VKNDEIDFYDVECIEDYLDFKYEEYEEV